MFSCPTTTIAPVNSGELSWEVDSDHDGAESDALLIGRRFEVHLPGPMVLYHRTWKTGFCWPLSKEFCLTCRCGVVRDFAKTADGAADAPMSLSRKDVDEDVKAAGRVSTPRRYCCVCFDDRSRVDELERLFGCWTKAAASAGHCFSRQGTVLYSSHCSDLRLSLLKSLQCIDVLQSVVVMQWCGRRGWWRVGVVGVSFNV